jgi:hypothetical protein
MTNHPNRSKRSPKISAAEMAAGQRADFKVFYRRNGKLFFDAMWAGSADEAKSKMLGFAKELRWAIEIVRVEAITADA